MAQVTLRGMGVVTPDDPLDNVVKVRLEKKTLRDLDRIEALARGAGHRRFTRSDMIRSAITAYIDGIREQWPQIDEIELPEEGDD